jgi:DNA polymerase V
VGSGRSWWSGSFVELRGVPSDAVETIEPQRKGMAVTWSFGTPVIDFSTLMGALSQYAMRAGEKLRQHGLNAARLTVFFHPNRTSPIVRSMARPARLRFIR